MGFLLGLLPSAAPQRSLDAAWELQPQPEGPQGSAVLEGDGWRFHYHLPRADRESTLWIEDGPVNARRSFVYVAGWCYRSADRSARLTEHDLRDVLRRHRDGQPPLTDEHFGTFTLVVHDHVTGRIAIIPDRFALSAT